jgi:hypothetical protein
MFFLFGVRSFEGHVLEKPKDGKSNFGATNFLEVLLDDEETTMQQLNKLCGNENVFSYTQVPRRWMPIEMVPCGIMHTPKFTGKGIGMNKETSVRSKIFSHFIKGKISFSYMETILMILREL